MKKQRVNIWRGIALLLVFITGQLIIYGHHHVNDKPLADAHATHKKHSTKGADDQCQICNQNSHVQLFLQTQQYFFFTSCKAFNHAVYNVIYKQIKATLFASRGPPYIA